MSPHVFLHVATMGSFWREVVSELCGEINGSGLYDRAASLNAVVVGGERWAKTPLTYQRWRVFEAGELWRYEYPTLQRLWRHARDETDGQRGHYLYLHTKGVREENSRRYRAMWRRWMSYYLVTRWRDSVTKLEDGFDVVGSLAIGEPMPHFAGNFWWARGDYLATLPEPRPVEFGINERVWAEMWVCHRQPRPKRFDWGTPKGSLDATWELELYRKRDRWRTRAADCEATIANPPAVRAV